MAHIRELIPINTDSSRMLASIGCNINALPLVNADIEYTLYRASQESLENLDFRTLSLIVHWIDIHGSIVNIPRLKRFLRTSNTETQQLWGAIAQWKQEQKKWASLIRLNHPNQRWDLLPAGTDFQISRKGEDPRFIDTKLRIPNGLLPIREGDVLSLKYLIQHHPTVANRVRFGVCLRADLWTHLEIEPNLSVAQLAKRVGCAFASAWEVKRDFDLLMVPGLHTAS